MKIFVFDIMLNGRFFWNVCLPYNEETAKLIGTTNNVEG